MYEAEAIQQFRDAIRSFGMVPPDGIEPDKLHRFSTNGKASDDAGWCKLFPDRLGGVFGDHRSGLSETWQAKREKPFTETERRAFKKRCEQERQARNAERDRQHAEARKMAQKILGEAKPENGEHRYLRDKGINAYGIRCAADRLVIPMRDTQGTLHSVQYIDPRGDKLYLKGGRVCGCYYAIGKPNGTLCIYEGYATGASIHEATGHAVAVAFDAGNLKPVAAALHAKYSGLHLVICADDDVRTKGNPGLTKATAAAGAVNGVLAVPTFGHNRPEGASDFNDLAQHGGLDAVRDCIANAQPPKRDEIKSRLDTAPGGNGEGGITYRWASDIQAKPIRWLWPGRIGRGKMTTLAGNPGLGKSQITASLAAIVSIGGIWPVDRAQCERGNVVILSAEDDPADTIRPRLEAAEADLSRVIILDGIVRHSDGSRALSLKSDMDKLGATLTEIGDVALVVIDPITAYLGDADSHKNAEIRGLLTPLADLAAKHETAVVCVSHLNKSGGSDAMMRVTGSLAFVAAARAVFLVAKDKENEARRLFLPMKNNIGNDRTGLAFSVQSAQVDSAAGLIDTSRVMWEAKPVTVTADEAMREHADGGGQTATDEAVAWLTELLNEEGGMIDRRDALRLAEAIGYKARTVHRARAKLALIVEQSGFGKDKRSVWKLPESPNRANDTQSCQAYTVGTHGTIGTNEGIPDDAEIFEVCD